MPVPTTRAATWRRIAARLVALATGFVLVAVPVAAAPPAVADVVAPTASAEVEPWFAVTLASTDVRVGMTVSADVATGVSDPDFTYQWFRGEDAIAGAESAQYVVTTDDLDKELSVLVTGTAPDVEEAVLRSDPTAPVEPGVLQTGTLTVSPPAPKFGDTLTVKATGTWTLGTTFAYEWALADGTVIGDAATLKLTAAEVGKAITLQVTASLNGYEDAVWTKVTGTVKALTFTTAPIPTISGTPQVGKVLTAKPGTWSPTPKFTYQWYRGTSAISGATKATYTPTASDLGKQLKVQVTGSLTGYTTLSKTSALTVKVKAGVLSAPVPTLSGTVRVGSKVTVKPGTWTPSVTPKYQWYIGGKAVPGTRGTASSITPNASEAGKTLSVKVTGSKTGYTTKTTQVTSAKPIAKGVFSTAPTPKVSGTLRVGQTLSVSRGTWKPTPSSYAYQWRANGVAIPGATKSTFTLTSAQRGKTITVAVTAKATGYSNKTMVSAASAKVVQTFTKAPTPTISGTAKVGSTLKVNRGTWSPTPTFTQQWKRNGVAIAGATGTSYKLTGADYGKTITVTVTAKATNWVTASKTSAATAKIGAPSPVITSDGTYKVGSGGIAPGTYVSKGGDYCYFELRSNAGSDFDGINSNDLGDGQRIVTIKSTDKYFKTQDCGSWTPYVAMGAVLTSTPDDGVFVVGNGGGQLKPGTYFTSGGVGGYGCYVAALSGFSGSLYDIIDNDYFYGYGYWDVYASDLGFETSNCSWTRVG